MPRRRRFACAMVLLLKVLRVLLSIALMMLQDLRACKRHVGDNDSVKLDCSEEMESFQ